VLVRRLWRLFERNANEHFFQGGNGIITKGAVSMRSGAYLQLLLRCVITQNLTKVVLAVIKALQKSDIVFNGQFE
jgi:uncharacterized membrane protein